MVEKDTRKHVKALRSDKGGEYISNEFKNFCAKEGIQIELIVPHKRNKKTIMGATRAMLHD